MSCNWSKHFLANIFPSILETKFDKTLDLCTTVIIHKKFVHSFNCLGSHRDNILNLDTNVLACPLKFVSSLYIEQFFLCCSDKGIHFTDDLFLVNMASLSSTEYIWTINFT